MKEIIKMLVVLSAICGVCGLLLAGVRAMTAETIASQELLFVKGPAVKRVLEGSDNDLMGDRAIIEVDGTEYTVFVGKKGGKTWAVAYETTGQGFGGDIGVITGINLETDLLTGIGITTHKETPGLGSHVEDSDFSDRFTGRSVAESFMATLDGGVIDAVTGATNSTRGVCEGVRKSVGVYSAIKSKVMQ